MFTSVRVQMELWNCMEHANDIHMKPPQVWSTFLKYKNIQNSFFLDIYLFCCKHNSEWHNGWGHQSWLRTKRPPRNFWLIYRKPHNKGRKCFISRKCVSILYTLYTTQYFKKDHKVLSQWSFIKAHWHAHMI